MENQLSPVAVLTGEQRAANVELAKAARPGPWAVVPWVGAPAAADGTWPTQDRSKWGARWGIQQADCYGKDGYNVVYGDHAPWGNGASPADAVYMAAISPDVLLAYEAALTTSETQAAELRRELAEAKSGNLDVVRDLLASLYDDDLHPLTSFIGNDFKAGINHERSLNAKLIELKARELGVWPLATVAHSGISLACPSSCSTCEKKAEAIGEIIGYYETTGRPVYEHHDYVTDVEGCYLTRAEADALTAEEPGAASATQGQKDEPQELWPSDPLKRQTYSEYRAACVKSGSTRLDEKAWKKCQKSASATQGKEGGVGA